MPWPPRVYSLRQVLVPYEISNAMHASSGRDYYQESLEFPRLGTLYSSIYSPKNGAILAYNSKKVPKEPVHWSDATFAMWQTTNLYTSTSSSPLRYIARISIDNPDTVSIIRTIERSLLTSDLGIMLYPTGPTGEYFRAILGTPNGSGPVFILLDHKKALGKRTISRISIYKAKGRAVYDMLLDVNALGFGYDFANETLSNQSTSSSSGARPRPSQVLDLAPGFDNIETS